MTEASWPTEIRLSPDKMTLSVAFEDGLRLELAAELLRVESPSAEVQGHAAHEKRLVARKSAIRIVGIDPVGNYAVRLVFDDGHSTGLFSWSYLRHLGERQDEIMSDYVRRLAEAGLPRS